MRRERERVKKKEEEGKRNVVFVRACLRAHIRFDCI